MMDCYLTAGRDEAWVRDWATQMTFIQFLRVGWAVKEIKGKHQLG